MTINDYLLCFMGWLITEAIFFSIDKDEDDKEDLKFDFGKYFYKRLDNAIVSLIISFSILIGGSEAIFEKLEFGYILEHLSVPLAIGISGWGVGESLKAAFKKLRGK